MVVDHLSLHQVKTADLFSGFEGFVQAPVCGRQCRLQSEHSVRRA